MKATGRLNILLMMLTIAILISIPGCSVLNKSGKSGQDGQTTSSNNAGNKSELKGIVNETNGEEISIIKVIQGKNGNSSVKKPGTNVDSKYITKFKIKKDTVITVRNSPDMGKTYTDKTGSVDDVKFKAWVDVSCEKQGDSIIAKTVIVWTFNK